MDDWKPVSRLMLAGREINQEMGCGESAYCIWIFSEGIQRMKERW
jgi:hypothetical protein